MSETLSAEVLRALAALDERTAALARASGLACPPLCGICCTTPAVETSVLEMLPMAQELFRRGLGEAWLARSTAPTTRSLCTAYEHDPDELERGRCSMYAWRPAICRLYAFAGRLDKHGRPELVACPRHEAEQPSESHRADELVRAGFPVALFSAVTLEIAALHPTLGAERLPIRAALARALEIVGLGRSMSARDDAPERRPA